MARKDMWLTPTTVQVEPTPGRREKRKAYRASIGRQDVAGCLAEQVQVKTMWPTPLAQEGGPDFAKIERCNRQSGKGLTLTTTVALKEREMFPTPLANEGRHAAPTDWEMNTEHGATKDSLRVRVNKRNFPTPTARDSKGGYNTKSLTRKDGKSRTFDGLPNAVLDGKGTETVTGALNPNWVEWLMGFPVGHTDLNSSETPSYLSWPSYFSEE